MVFDKKTLKAYNIRPKNINGPFAIENNIDMGYPFWPDCSTSEYMCMFVSSENLINFFTATVPENRSLDPKNNLPINLRGLTIQDNPVIIKVNLKK